MDSLFEDMIGFAACKMIRRIVGFAHVVDFESIQDPALRAACESRALAMARWMLRCPDECRSIDDVIGAVASRPPYQPSGRLSQGTLRR